MLITDFNVVHNGTIVTNIVGNRIFKIENIIEQSETVLIADVNVLSYLTFNNIEENVNDFKMVFKIKMSQYGQDVYWWKLSKPTKQFQNVLNYSFQSK